MRRKVLSDVFRKLFGLVHLELATGQRVVVLRFFLQDLFVKCTHVRHLVVQTWWVYLLLSHPDVLFLLTNLLHSLLVLLYFAHVQRFVKIPDFWKLSFALLQSHCFFLFPLVFKFVEKFFFVNQLLHLWSGALMLFFSFFHFLLDLFQVL